MNITSGMMFGSLLFKTFIVLPAPVGMYGVLDAS